MASKALLEELEARKQKARDEASDEVTTFKATVAMPKTKRARANYRAAECVGRKLGYWAGLADALALIRKDVGS